MSQAFSYEISEPGAWSVPPARLARITALLGLAVAAAVIPTAFAQSQPYNWRNVVTGAGGGFVPGIVFNSTQPNLIYARTDIGGAYRWNAATNRWIPLMDFVGWNDWNTLGVESIATDPADPNRLYIAAGTYTNFFTNANGAILRSTDQGNTFQRTDVPFKLGGNMPGRSMGERLVIDPNLNSTLYLGARSGNGLWKSTDFGVTWSRVTSFTATGTYVEKAGDAYLGDTDGVVWEVFDPRTGTPGHATQTIYVGVADKGNSIFRSTDGGATWTPVPGQPTGFLPHHGVLASTGLLYITYSNGAGPYDGSSGDVWKFDTRTGVWTRISPVPSTDTANDYFGYGGLAVDAQHPNTIMVSALNSWWPDTIFFRSIDAGATWTRVWDWTSYPNRSLRYAQDISAAPWLNFGNTNPIPPVPSPKLGWMVGALQIDPFNSDRMLYGTGATIYGTNDLTNWDAGVTFQVTVAAQGIEEEAVLDLVSPPSGPPLFSAMGDVTGFRHDDLTASPAAMFTAPTSGTTSSIDFAELNPGFLVRVGSPNNSTTPPTNSTGFTFNGGSSWFQGNTEPPGVTGGGTIAAAANASRVLWSDPGGGVRFSTDNGNTWMASTGIPTGAKVVSDRVNPMKFYGFANGTFYVSANGGVSFTAVATAGLPPAGAPVRFKAVPGREGDIWFAGGSDGAVYGLWRSTDSGATFTKLANLEKADVIGFGMPAPGQTYVTLFTSAQIAGVRGIFRSDNAGASWVRINDDQHQYGITGQCMTGDPRIYGRVYFCTNGRGIIAGDIGGAPAPDFSLSATPAMVTVTQGASGTSAIGITRTGGFTGSVALTATGLPAGVTAAFSPSAASGASSTLTFTASSTAATGPATVIVTGLNGSLTHTVPVSLTVNAVPTAGFSLSENPASIMINQGASGTSAINITRTGGFTGTVGLAATGLPAGVTAAFDPVSATGSTSTLTLTASNTATTGLATVTVTGTSGTLSPRTVTIALTVNPIAPSDFSLTASPAALTINQGASGTSTITITRTGLTGSVSFTASGLPAGVTAAFNPASTTGAGSTMTLTASSTAATGPAAITVTGTSGSLSHATTIALTVNPAASGNGGVTVSTVINSNSPWFDDEGVKLSNTAGITALSIAITVQNTGGITFSGQYNTVGGSIVQSHSSTASTIAYQFNLAPGQTLSPGTSYLFDAQMGGMGTAHPAAGDTYTVTYTTGGQIFTQSGHF